MKWVKRIAIAVGLLLAVVAVLPFVISVDDYRPRIEQEISARLGEPVTIRSLRAYALPAPHVTAEDIVIGKGGDLKVAKIMIAPDLWSLFGETRVIRSVELRSVQLTQNGIAGMGKFAMAGKTDPNAPQRPAVRVIRVQIENATVQLGTGNVGPFDAAVALDQRGAPEQLSLTLKDGKFNAIIKPDAGRYVIEVVAKSWRLPIGPPLTFDDLKITGVATLNDAHISAVQARLFGGTVSGNATLAWNKGAQLRGTFEVNQLELAPLMALVSPRSGISGRLNAKPVISASAPTLEQLSSALRVETPFQVHNGVLRGVDIRKAATNFLMKGPSGETRFDQLSGHLVMERGTQRFSNLKVVSGVLSAEGNVTISPNKALSGRLNARVGAGTVAPAMVPLNVSGTVDSPMLLPNAAALAGVAAGAAVLGPPGAAAGVKAGSWVEGLFGQKK